MKVTRTRGWVLGSIVAVSALLLAACGGGGDTPPSGANQRMRLDSERQILAEQFEPHDREGHLGGAVADHFAVAGKIEPP